MFFETQGIVFTANVMAIFRRGHQQGVECKGVWKMAIFDQSLRNDIRYSYNYGKQIENRTQAVKWYQFQLPW